MIDATDAPARNSIVTFEDIAPMTYARSLKTGEVRSFNFYFERIDSFQVVVGRHEYTVYPSQLR